MKYTSCLMKMVDHPEDLEHLRLGGGLPAGPGPRWDTPLVGHRLKRDTALDGTWPRTGHSPGRGTAQNGTRLDCWNFALDR